MKLHVFVKISFLLFCAFSSTQLNGSILINDNAKGEKSTITKPSQNTEEIKIIAISEIGTYPEFKGVNTILKQLKKNVEVVLRGDKPYRVKTNDENGTVIPARQGNALVLEVALIPCEEDRRNYFFDAAALIYTSIDPKEEKAVHSKIRTAVMDKATASFAGAEVQEAYPNNINLIGFTGLNTIDPSKEYKLILKFLVGKRVGGYQYIGDDVSDINKANESSNKLLQYASLPKVYLPNNQSPKLTDGLANLSNANTVEKTTLDPRNENRVGTTRPTVKEGQDSKFDAQVALKKLLLYEAAIKKSKLSNSKKQEALEKLSVVKKQMKDIIELKKFGEDWDDALNHAEERDKNGKIVKSILSKYLNESDKILLLKILNGEIESDPESRNFGSYVCGTTIANCKFCGTRINVNKYYESLGGIFISLHRTPLIGLSIKEADIKELKSYLGLIRSGKYYICIKKDKELFCTPEHKYLFDKR